MSKNQHAPTPRRSCSFRSEDLQPTSSSKPKVPPSSIASTSGDRGTMPQISGRMPEHMVVYWHTTLAHYTGHYTGTRPYSFIFHLCQKMLSSWLLLPLTKEPEYKTNSSFCNYESFDDISGAYLPHQINSLQPSILTFYISCEVATVSGSLWTQSSVASRVSEDPHRPRVSGC